MPEVWPGSLPRKFRNPGHASAVADGRLISEPDLGPPLVRRRTSAKEKPLSGTMTMSTVQVTALDFFVETTLLGGSLPFLFPDPMGGYDLLVTFQKDKLPSWRGFAPDQYEVSLDLWIMP